MSIYFAALLMSAFGPKRTCAGALQMSACDPKPTFKVATLPHLCGGYGLSGNFSPERIWGRVAGDAAQEQGNFTLSRLH